MDKSVILFNQARAFLSEEMNQIPAPLQAVLRCAVFTFDYDLWREFIIPELKQQYPEFDFDSIPITKKVF